MIDGYSATCPDNFHVNWGWKGNHNGFSDLNACGYSNGQKVIVGIAPVQDCKLDFSISCTQINKNVNACPDSKDSKLRFSVSNADSYQCTIYDRNKKVYWRSAGVVRSSSVDVWDGSSASKLLEDTYYYEVVFKNSKGCCKTANGSFVYSSLPLFNSIQYELKKEMMWISPNCEPSWLTFDVENVEMWKFDLYDRNKKHLDTYKGTVKDGIAMVWSGESSRKLISKNDYWFTVEFFDKCESSQLYEGHRTVLDWECFATDETLIYSDAEEKIFFMQDVGNTILSFCSIDQNVHIKIYDVKGMLFFDLDTDDFSYKLDISSLPKGLYFVDMIGNGWSKQSKFMHK